MTHVHHLKTYANNGFYHQNWLIGLFGACKTSLKQMFDQPAAISLSFSVSVSFHSTLYKQCTYGYQSILQRLTRFRRIFGHLLGAVIVWYANSSFQQTQTMIARINSNRIQILVAMLIWYKILSSMMSVELWPSETQAKNHCSSKIWNISQQINNHCSVVYAFR